jgi:acyl-CoA synthetase (AMP-forming)/AMP-acid ligase II
MTVAFTPPFPRCELTLWDSLHRAVAIGADKPATLTHDGQLRTWQQVYERVRSLAAGLLELGLRPGDRLAVALPNQPEYLECFYACAMAGLIIAPLNTRLAPTELARYLQLVEPAAILTSTSRSVPSEATGTSLLITMDDSKGPAGLSNVSYVDLLTANPLQAPIERPEDEPAAVFATGGTTGTPRGVTLTTRNLVTNAYHMQMSLNYGPDDRYLHASPMFHIADCASLFAVTLMGGSHTFLPSFSPAAFAHCLQTTRASATLLVPTMVHMLLDDPSVQAADLSSWRLLFYGGAPMPPATLARAMQQLPCDFAQGYGMTELSLATVLTSSDHSRATTDACPPSLLRSAGRAAPGVRVRIDSPGPDGVGEVLVGGPNTFAGYWQAPDATRAARTPDGWVRTGDLGRLDDAGYLYLVDRRKDMIITGGENVYSVEVEQVLAEHPAVSEVAVIGVPDARWGERVHAIVVLRSGAGAVPTEELDRLARHHLAAYKIPRSYESAESLPTTGPGKIDKKKLRAVQSDA